MARKKSSGPTVKVKLGGKRKVKMPLYVFLILVLVCGIAIGGYFIYQRVQASKSSESTSFSTSSAAPIGDHKDFVFIVNESLASKYGDSLYFKYGDFDCLVDGGDNDKDDRAMVASTLSTYCTDHKLDLFVCTHSHSDHVGYFSGETAASNTIKNGGITSIGYVIDSGSAKTSASFYNSYMSVRDSYMVSTLGATYIPVKSLFSNYTAYSSFYGNNVISISGEGTNPGSLVSAASGNVNLYVLNTNSYLEPGATSDSEPNNTSVSCLLKVFDKAFLFCGDADKGAQDGIMANYSQDGKPSLWGEGDDLWHKANHHAADPANSGGAGCNRKDWIQWMKPDHVIISSAILASNATSSGVAGEQHPFPRSIKIFETVTSSIYWNGVNGKITLSMPSSSSSIAFQGSEKQVPYYDSGSKVSGEENTTFLNSKWFNSSVYQSEYNAITSLDY